MNLFFFFAPLVLVAGAYLRPQPAEDASAMPAQARPSTSTCCAGC